MGPIRDEIMVMSVAWSAFRRSGFLALRARVLHHIRRGRVEALAVVVDRRRDKGLRWKAVCVDHGIVKTSFICACGVCFVEGYLKGMMTQARAATMAVMETRGHMFEAEMNWAFSAEYNLMVFKMFADWGISSGEG